MDEKPIFRPKIEYTETKTQPTVEKLTEKLAEKSANIFLPNIKDLLQIKSTLKRVV
jgi:hypothetical protein